MLDALLPGKNYLWSVSWERRLGKGLELQLQYDGRLSPGKNAVHTGNLGIRALL
jgi:hypothetical protein